MKWINYMILHWNQHTIAFYFKNTFGQLVFNKAQSLGSWLLTIRKIFDKKPMLTGMNNKAENGKRHADLYIYKMT